MGAYRNAIAISISGDDFETGSIFTKVAKGIKKGVKATAKVVKRGAKLTAAPVVTAHLFVAKKVLPKSIRTPKGVLKLAKKGGRVVLKGGKAAVKFARAHKGLVAATVLAPAGAVATAYGASKLARAALKKSKGKPGTSSPGEPKALSPVSPGTGPAASVAPGGGGGGGGGDGGGEDGGEDTDDSDESTEDGGDTDDGGDDGADGGTDDGPSDDGGDTDDGGDDGEEDAEESAEASDGGDENNVSGDNTMDEFVGFDEIAGDEDVSGDEYVGLDEIAGPAKRKGGVKGPNAALVRSKGYNKARRQPLPFNSSGTVAAAASALITVIPQTLFRGRKLVIGPAIAASFTVDSISVGNVSQLAAAGSQSAEVFLPTTTGEDNIMMDSCPPGMSIFLGVTNTSGGALQFRATIFGDSVQ